MFKWIKDAKKLPQAIRDREAAERREHEANRIAATAQQTLQESRIKVAELEGKIRKQNEADLLMVSMELVSRLTAGAKKDSPEIASLLGRQAAAMQNAYPYGMPDYYYSGLANFGMGAAAGNLLGGLWYDQGPGSLHK